MKNLTISCLLLIASPSVMAFGNSPWSPFWNNGYQQYQASPYYYPQANNSYQRYRSTYNNNSWSNWMPYSNSNNEWSWGPWDSMNNAWNGMGNFDGEFDVDMNMKLKGLGKVFTDTRTNNNNNLYYRGNQQYRQYNNGDYRNNWFGR